MSKENFLFFAVLLFYLEKSQNKPVIDFFTSAIPRGLGFRLFFRLKSSEEKIFKKNRVLASICFLLFRSFVLATGKFNLAELAEFRFFCQNDVKNAVSLV